MHPPSLSPLKTIYESPILALQNNILFGFENASPGFANDLRKAVANGLISTDIELIRDLIPARGPKVTRSGISIPAVMHLYITHLEMLWAFIVCAQPNHLEWIVSISQDRVHVNQSCTPCSKTQRIQALRLRAATGSTRHSSRPNWWRRVISPALPLLP